MIKKILFITPTNLGDVILTLPALDVLRANFPQAKITVMTGLPAKEIFEGNPSFELIIYNKYKTKKQKTELFFVFLKKRFDVVIDLRNTLYGVLLSARYKTSPFLRTPPKITQMHQRNLYKVEKALRGIDLSMAPCEKSLYISAKDTDYIEHLLNREGVCDSGAGFIAVVPFAKGPTRRWAREKFMQVCKELSCQYKIILIGRETDRCITQFIKENCLRNVFDFAGLTNITQLACLLKKASLVICLDTGILHLASYMETRILAIFGPSKEEKYGPWREGSLVVSRQIRCRPCARPHCRFNSVQCMQLIKPEDVINRAKQMLQMLTGQSQVANRQSPIFERILIVRTDRLGDVLLSTPVIKALRDSESNAYIAMMVRKETADIVLGNPYLDQVLIYDKYGIHKSWWGTLKFALMLRKERFNLAIILHPTNRAHLVAFFAQIPRRIGYHRKLGFLLTDRIKHTKEEGRKHELEYNLDLVRYLNIEPKDKSLLMPIRPDSEKRVQALFKQYNLTREDTEVSAYRGETSKKRYIRHKIVVINPAASCPSKMWPRERFAHIADRLIEDYHVKIIIITGPGEEAISKEVAKEMRCPAIDLGGKTSVSVLASLLKRASLLISTDSGPMHIAAALGVSVLAIFGRAQPGLSPRRWGPVGENTHILHKDVGCKSCLAHNCTKGFACLKAISENEVFDCVDQLMKS